MRNIGFVVVVFLLALARPGGAQLTPMDVPWEHWGNGDTVTISAGARSATYRVLRADRNGSGWEEVEISGSRFDELDGRGRPTGRRVNAPPSRLYILRGNRGIQNAFTAGGAGDREAGPGRDVRRHRHHP